MRGERYLLDTNAIIALLQGNQQLIQLLQDAEWIGISIISQIEFLVFPGLNEADRQLFNEFLQRVEIVWIEPSQPELIELTIQLRQQYRLRLPDGVRSHCYKTQRAIASIKSKKKLDKCLIVQTQFLICDRYIVSNQGKFRSGNNC